MKVQGLDEVAFRGGRIVISQGARALREQGLDVHQLLQRHFLGDDGDVSGADHQRNLQARLVYSIGERALAGENKALSREQLESLWELDSLWDRVFSSYETKQGKVYIITEADRSYTTVLLPSEY